MHRSKYFWNNEHVIAKLLKAEYSASHSNAETRTLVPEYSIDFQK